MQLQPSERETHLSQTADDHTRWEVYTDDPLWIRRLERLGIAPYKVVGTGRHYRLTNEQVLIRRGKPQVSEATRTARAARLQNLHRAGSLDTKQPIVA